MYRHAITPARVAELLILRGDMPRSLLPAWPKWSATSRRWPISNGETERCAGMMHAELRYGRIDDILHTGMHALPDRFSGAHQRPGRAHQPGFSGGLNARAAMP